MDEQCRWCADVDHVPQGARWVDKHEHQGYPPRVYPCDKPWSAGCQTDHGSLCFIGDYETQAEAVQAMSDHMHKGVHLQGCADDNEPTQECVIRAGKECVR